MAIQIVHSSSAAGARLLYEHRASDHHGEMLTNYCPECAMNWSPYQTPRGCCPLCGGGTRRSYDPPSDDSVELHKAALAAQWRRELYDRFETYYAEREARRDAA